MSASEDYKVGGERQSYRSGMRSTHSSSDDSSDGEEDTPLWRQKQEKYFRKQKGNVEVMSSSPSRPEVKTDLAPQRKKSNNIWGSVLTEQDLTQTLIKSAAVDKPEELSYNERNVESYDYTKKYEDRRRSWDEPESASLTNRNDIFDPSLKARLGPAPGRSIIDYEDTVEKSRDSRRQGSNTNRRNRKRKADGSNDREQRSGIHDRLGMKKMATTKLGEIDMNVDMISSELISKIAEFLHEPKVEIIERIVTHVGKDFAIRLVQATRDVEESGGMYTLDGSRRRTPGGVYLTLLKQQPEWNKDVRKLVFVEDVEEQERHKKEKRKKTKRHRKKKHQADKQNGKQGQNKSRSRSNSNSSLKSTPQKNEDAEEVMEDGEIRSRSNSGDCNHEDSRKHESSGESDSDEEYDNRQKSNWSKPFNFEDELAAAKKVILEKSNTQKKADVEMMESENNASQGKETVSGMADLDTAEADVVDIEIGIDA